MKQVWVAVHDHQYGQTVYVFAHRVSEHAVTKKIMAVCGDFDPERESITIHGPETIKESL